MARRRSRKAAKLETVENELWFDIGDAPLGSFVDLGQCLCLVNRKSAYRQGMEYVFKIELFGADGSSPQISIRTLPDSWPTSGAWTKLFHAWKDQQDDAAREAGLESTTARYRDFKIFMNSVHVGAGFGANLIPDGYTLASATGSSSYEWLPSQVVLPNEGGPGVTEERYLHMTGIDGATSSSMILAYAQSRARPHVEDPNIVNPVSGGLLADMQDVGDDNPEIILNLQEHNNTPPYLIENDNPHEAYPGGQFQGSPLGNLRDILSVRSGTGSVSSDTTPWLTAQCGLISLGMLNTAGAFMKITVMQGPHAGVMARSMMEV